MSSKTITRQSTAVSRLSIPKVLLVITIFMAAVLGFYNLQAIGTGNVYYSAAVKSMLMSGKNFFYLAAEPGGSVSVDKPPLGLWLQALSAMLLGVNGPALALPEVLAGILSIPLLYHLIQRTYGEVTGFFAALILAVSPVSVSTMRINTMDSILVLTSLLTAWAFIKAAEESQWRWLFLGSLLVGIGFNVKMLEAFLPLPAFIIAYFLGSSQGWFKKIKGLAVAAVIILVVSFSWAVMVDLTPASQRPFIGSTDHNSEILLSLGYNGLVRIVGNPGLDVGAPGPLRLFINPLAQNIGWMLPLALAALLFSTYWLWRNKFSGQTVLSAWKTRFRVVFPLSTQEIGFLLWGLWMLAEFVFFSEAGNIRAYYVNMLAPPLAASLAIGFYFLWKKTLNWWGWLLIGIVAGLVLAFQGLVVAGAPILSVGIFMIVVVGLSGLGSLALAERPGHSITLEQKKAGLSAMLIVLLVFPFIWSVLVMLNPNPDVMRPSAYQGNIQNYQNDWRQVDPAFLAYLQNHTQGQEYLVGVPNAVLGAPYVLATGRPVMYIGGFNGTDPVLSPQSLAKMVHTNRLRFVWDIGTLSYQQKSIYQWLQTSCQAVKDAPLPAIQLSHVPGSPTREQLLQAGDTHSISAALYDCH